MENIDMSTILPIIKQMGITPDTMGPEKLQQFMELAESITDPSQINNDIVYKLKNILGIKTNNESEHINVPKIKKIPRNKPCTCKSGIKWKKCCGKPK
jgi:uncharacterized protein YecA (UPF0149 family)